MSSVSLSLAWSGQATFQDQGNEGSVVLWWILGFQEMVGVADMVVKLLPFSPHVSCPTSPGPV